jgi:hypothetical protein
MSYLHGKIDSLMEEDTPALMHSVVRQSIFSTIPGGISYIDIAQYCVTYCVI